MGLLTSVQARVGVLDTGQPVGGGYVQYYSIPGVSAPTDFNTATAYVKSLDGATPGANTLVLPPSPGVPYSGVFGSSNVNAGLNITCSIAGWRGQGANTVLTSTGGYPVAPTGSGTNSAYAARCDNAVGLSWSDFRIDAGSPAAANACGGFRYRFGGPRLTRIWVYGVRGLKNTPPEETFGFCAQNSADGLYHDDCQFDGLGIGAAGFAINTFGGWDTATNGGAAVGKAVYNNCQSRNTGNSHGWAMYQANHIDLFGCKSTGAGLVTPTASRGAGYNFEETSPQGIVRLFSCVSDANSRWAMRVEAGDNGGINNPNFELWYCTFTNSPIGIFYQNLQSLPTKIDATTVNTCTAPTSATA